MFCFIELINNLFTCTHVIRLVKVSLNLIKSILQDKQGKQEEDKRIHEHTAPPITTVLNKLNPFSSI